MGAQCLNKGCQSPPGPKGYCAKHTKARKTGAAKIRAILDAPSKQFHESEFVYIIALDGHQAFKVGRSIDPVARLRELQTPMPIGMRLIEVFCVASSTAHKLESAAHEILRECGHHIKGEWFDADPQDISAVIRKCAATVGAHILSPHEAMALCREHIASSGTGGGLPAFEDKLARIVRLTRP